MLARKRRFLIILSVLTDAALANFGAQAQPRTIQHEMPRIVNGRLISPLRPPEGQPSVEEQARERGLIKTEGPDGSVNGVRTTGSPYGYASGTSTPGGGYTGGVGVGVETDRGDVNASQHAVETPTTQEPDTEPPPP